MSKQTPKPQEPQTPKPANPNEDNNTVTQA